MKMTPVNKILSASFLLIFLLWNSSCRIDIQELSEGDAAKIIESGLQSLTMNIEDVAAELMEAMASGEICDSLYSETIENDYQGAQIQASYTSDLSYEISCNLISIPQTASFSSTTESMYSSSRIESDDDAIFSGTVAGLEPSSSALALHGDYNKTGSQEVDFAEQQTVNSTLTADLSNIEIDKQSYNIGSGAGSFSFSGYTQDADFSYTGSIVFNGDDTATLTINGTAYVIDLN